MTVYVAGDDASPLYGIAALMDKLVHTINDNNQSIVFFFMQFPSST